ncbi:MAG: adaptor protein MecA [Lachnospiraceae bacterium]|nr:adaptor protein MecA [Lachnospiraceae bacterium]
MKIEKINDNKIRCTLTREDLEKRQISLGELAYGSEKARQLFREMLREAFRICGFKNEMNLPLMIEAIPSKEHTLVIDIQKVEDPEELDTRFSRFSATNVLPDSDEMKIDGADDILEYLNRISEEEKDQKEKEPQQDGQTAEVAAETDAQPAAEKQPQSSRSTGKAGKGSRTRQKPVILTRLYRFSNLDQVIDAAAALAGFYSGDNTLYRSETEGYYSLVLHQSAHTPEEYNKICNILSEYGKAEKYTLSAEAYSREHEELVFAHTALQELAVLTEG